MQIPSTPSQALLKRVPQSWQLSASLDIEASLVGEGHSYRVTLGGTNRLERGDITVDLTICGPIDVGERLASERSHAGLCALAAAAAPRTTAKALPSKPNEDLGDLALSKWLTETRFLTSPIDSTTTDGMLQPLRLESEKHFSADCCKPDGLIPDPFTAMVGCPQHVRTFGAVFWNISISSCGTQEVQSHKCPATTRM